MTTPLRQSSSSLHCNHSWPQQPFLVIDATFLLHFLDVSFIVLGSSSIVPGPPGHFHRRRVVCSYLVQLFFGSVKYTSRASGTYFQGFGKQTFIYSPSIFPVLLPSVRMEQLTKSQCNFSLLDKGRTNFILPEDHRKGEFVIITKFRTSRFLQMEVVVRTFKQLWRSNNGFRIHNQRNNIILFIFNNLVEIRQNS